MAHREVMAAVTQGSTSALPGRQRKCHTARPPTATRRDRFRESQRSQLMFTVQPCWRYLERRRTMPLPSRRVSIRPSYCVAVTSEQRRAITP